MSKAYRGKIEVEVVSYGKDSTDARENSGVLVEWSENSNGWLVNTDTGSWPCPKGTAWKPVGRFRRSPDDDTED